MLISVRPRQRLPAETEVQAGIGVESPKCVAPIAIGGVVGPLEARGRLGTPACRSDSAGRDSLAPIFFRGAAIHFSNNPCLN